MGTDSPSPFASTKSRRSSLHPVHPAQKGGHVPDQMKRCTDLPCSAGLGRSWPFHPGAAPHILASASARPAVCLAACPVFAFLTGPAPASCCCQSAGSWAVRHYKACRSLVFLPPVLGGGPTDRIGWLRPCSIPSLVWIAAQRLFAWLSQASPVQERPISDGLPSRLMQFSVDPASHAC